jgi:predicted nucleic acid-binding protein
MKIVVDTSILIDILRNIEISLTLIQKLARENELFISGITEAEIFSGKDLENEEKKQKVLKLLSFFRKTNPTNEILQKAGEFRRKYNTSLPDSIIAATAHHINAVILTKNEKDFSKIKEVKLLKEA